MSPFAQSGGPGISALAPLSGGKLVTSLRAIAAGLNEKGIPTARGDGEWTATQVMRVLERLDPFVEFSASA